MRAAPFTAQGKGAFELAVEFWSEKGGGCGGGGGCGVVEPRSVLDRRRSPSPPYSTSTLSSSLGSGGGGGGGGGGGVAAVSENSPEATKWAADHGGGGGGGMGQRKEEWGAELPPIAGCLDVGFVAGCGGVESWDAMLGAAAAAAASPGQEQTFLHWIMSDVDEHSALGLKPPPPPPPMTQAPPPLGGELGGDNAGFGFGLVDSLGFSVDHLGGASAISPPPLASDLSSSGGLSLTSSSGSNKASTFGNCSTGLFSPDAPPPAMFFQDPIDTKQQQLFGTPTLLFNHHHQQQPPNPASFFVPLPSYSTHLDHHHHPPPPPPPAKRHHSLPDGQDLFLLRNQLPIPHPQQQPPPPPPLHQPLAFPHLQPMKTKPTDASAAAQQHQQQVLDHLMEAAKAAESGNSIGAREILARLNHQLPAPIGKPFHRSAFYLKEALLLSLADSSTCPSLASPLDVALKLAAYKSFSDLSPFLQFANFTATQALLDELATTQSSTRIHLIDFDLGVGGQWASFMQELAHRRGAASPPMLKVTAFVSPASHHPLELHLTRDNLTQFAADLGIHFEFAALTLDSFDPASLIAPAADEVVAVSLPVGSSARAPPLPVLLRLVKQLAPKVLVAVDHGSDRSDLPFSQHFLHSFQSCMYLLDSLDAAGADADAAGKIERFLVQPRVEDAILGRRHTEKALPWRTLFASAGFAPLPLSNLAEAQADCLLKRVQVRGFHVEKRGAALTLYWQRGELVSISAWRC